MDVQTGALLVLFLMWFAGSGAALLIEHQETVNQRRRAERYKARLRMKDGRDSSLRSE